MNFFKSVFSDEPDPNSPADPVPSATADAAPPPPASAAVWDFGGLLKTISEKSESFVDTYRRDLQEFGTGLRKEIEAAHGSLEGVGHVFDDLGSSVLKGTAQIISQGKDAILAADALVKSDLSDHPSPASNPSYRVYSRFEAQLRALQGDAGTFGVEPEDAEDYAAWKSGFDLGAKKGEIEGLLDTNEDMMGIYERLVPGEIDYGTFWLRYFYRVHKLEQAESLRVNLVKRAISSEEEELSWDVYDDDEEEQKDDKGVELEEKSGDSSGVAKVEPSLSNATDLPPVVAAGEELDAVDPGKKPKEDVSSSAGCDHSEVEPVKVVEGKVNKETDAEHSEQGSSQNASSAKKADRQSDPEALPSRPVALEEEDLGWDEIEDLSSIDDNNDVTKSSRGGDPSPHREELRKRLSAADEEEDLSWDIEDDGDEPAKH
ncbi:hypothetical protein MLD38_040007 [Melastoma candidum]|uniref:Uncharacterized protein n=1 Tax=Melastoma candidum TaxID=119954 RepID=A0ACB9L3X4_9MYRT|nr:hypothetical protein MLD38_040007 [Melastoma candidum]